MKIKSLIGWSIVKREILLFLFIGVVFSLAFYSQKNILLVTPLQEVSGNSIFFSWESSYPRHRLLVDDVIGFTSPLIDVFVSGNSYLLQNSLNASIYYWKILGYDNNKVIESEVGQFNFISEVAIASWDEGDSYTLYNAGNTPLQISVQEGGIPSFTGAAVLDIGKTLEKTIENKTSFRAEQL